MVYCTIHYESHHGKVRIGACVLNVTNPKKYKGKLKEIIKEHKTECKFAGNSIQMERKNLEEF